MNFWVIILAWPFILIGLDYALQRFIGLGLTSVDWVTSDGAPAWPLLLVGGWPVFVVLLVLWFAHRRSRGPI